MYGPQGNLDAVSIKGTRRPPTATSSPACTPTSRPTPWADYRQALEDVQRRPGPGLQQPRRAWARGRRYTGFTQIVEAASTATIDRQVVPWTRRRRRPTWTLNGHGPGRSTSRSRGRTNPRLPAAVQPDGRLQPAQGRQDRAADRPTSRTSATWRSDSELARAIDARPGPGPARPEPAPLGRRRTEEAVDRGRGHPLRAARASASAPCTRSASQGLIVIYRGSGVLNFALGAIGMAGVYVAVGAARTSSGWPFVAGGDRRRRRVGRCSAR